VEQRLVLSKGETIKNIQQQAQQNKRMQLNLELAQSELERLESQIASLRAELISTPASQLSSRLGDTLIQVEASQRVLQEGGVVNAPDLNTLLGESA
jgi:cell division FtsZ-interacting protein ZapD